MAGAPAIIIAMTLGAGAALAAPPAAVDTVLGRMVAPRPGAPSGGTTSHVRAHYVLHCAGCHGAEGAGSESGGVPGLRRLGEFLSVPGGREFIIKVPGVMGSGLSDAEVAEVTNWVLATLARESVLPAHRPYDAQEVRRARTSPLVDVAAERARLVREARARGIRLY